ncbi:MAG: hypothetical protein ACOY3P_11260 [Planctomycetota bacterium]
MNHFHRLFFLSIVASAMLATEDRSFAATIELALDTGHAAHVVAPGQEDRVAIKLTNPTDSAAEVTLCVEVESFDGAKLDAEDRLTIPAGDTKRWPLPKRLFGALGIKWVRFWIDEDGNDPEVEEASFAYMTPNGPTTGRANGFLFGLAYGAGPDNHAQRAAERAALCGVKIVRGHPVWPRIQPKPDVWDWSSCDAIVEAHAKYGIETQLLLSGAPRWSFQSDGVPTTEAWGTFCRELARRYRGTVRFYELWNEPDIGFFKGTQEQYIDLLRVGFRAIKEADPSAQVTTAGFASWSHAQTKPGMVPRVISECQDSYDLIAYHRHGEFPGFRDELQQHLLPYCKAVLTSPKPLYFTETGMDTRHGQHFQARTLPKKLAFAWANGAVAYTWFNLHDMRAAEHPRQPGFTYGLYTRLDRSEGSQSSSPEDMHYDQAWPKAVYVAYNTLTSLLTSKRFQAQYELGPDQYAYLFSGGGEHVVLAWCETAAAGSPHLVLATGADHAARVDLMGNRYPWPVVEGQTVLPLNEEPAYLRMVGGPPPELKGRLIASAPGAHAVPGRPLTVEVEIWNPTQQPASVRTEWQIPEGLTANPSAQQLSLGPGERKTIALEATASPAARSGFGHVFPCELRYRFEPIGWSGAVVAPVTMGAVRAPQGDLPKQATFRLDEPRQVVNLSEHDPHTAHLLWKGRQDLSADIRVAWAEAGLKVQLDVRDDQHHVPSPGQPEQGDWIEILTHVRGNDQVCRLAIAATGNEPHVRILGASRAAQAAASEPQASAWGTAPWRHYAITLPFELMGNRSESLNEGVRLNVRVHDNDGRGRKGWLQVAPGDTLEDSASWPLILVEP